MDDPSNAELGRLIQALRGDVRDDMAQIQSRLDRLVSADAYAGEKAATAKRTPQWAVATQRLEQKPDQDVRATTARRAQGATRGTQPRRYLVASVLIPVLGLVLPLVLFLVGGK